MTLQVTPLDIAQGYIKTLSLEKQLLLGHCATVTLLPRRHVPPPQGTMRAGHLCVRMSVSLVSGRMCVYSRKRLPPVPARMHYTECHSGRREQAEVCRLAQSC